MKSDSYRFPLYSNLFYSRYYNFISKDVKELLDFHSHETHRHDILLFSYPKKNPFECFKAVWGRCFIKFWKVLTKKMSTTLSSQFHSANYFFFWWIETLLKVENVLLQNFNILLTLSFCLIALTLFRSRINKINPTTWQFSWLTFSTWRCQT